MSVKAIKSALDMKFEFAAAAGYPAFTRRIEDSTPENSSPYLTEWSTFCEQVLSVKKTELRAALSSALKDLESREVRPEVILVGGSFLGPDLVPNDIDAVVFYSCGSHRPVDLHEWVSAQKTNSLDLRLVPLELEPTRVLKLAIYFSILYSQRKSTNQQTGRGLLLIDYTGQPQYPSATP